MKTIYAVSSGHYSDYSVIALFSTEADAKLFMERHQDRYSEWNDLETYELDAGVSKMRKGFARFWVQMSDDGSTSQIGPYASGVSYKPDPEFREPMSDGKRWFNWYGWARDSGHAVKIANEYRLKLLLGATEAVPAAPPSGGDRE